jgi:hypothetical protein
LAVPARAGISSVCAIYVIFVGSVPTDGNGNCDPAINQLAGDGASSAIVVEMPFYSFDLHLAGKHHPVSAEIVPQMKMERLQLFAAAGEGRSGSPS